VFGGDAPLHSETNMDIAVFIKLASAGYS
jgi:hypothetical protein